MLSDVVAERIAAIRKREGLTREELAERCITDYHWPGLTHGVIGSIETGRRDEAGRRRREVSTDELVVLAKALGVPPLLLMFPVDKVEQVELFPGHETSTWGAARWFSGEAPIDDQDRNWVQGAAPITMLRQHDRYVADWTGIPIAVHGDTAEAADARFEDKLAKRREIEIGIKHVRESLRQLGVALPGIPSDLAYMIGEEP